MKAGLLVTVLLLATMPSLAMAMCFKGHAEEQITMSCPEGQVFDTETNSCITPTG